MCKLERAGIVTKTSDNQSWENTTAGNANASAGPKSPRTSAEKQLKGLLHRAAAVNGNAQYAYIVKRISIFGSYLSDQERLSDVDVVIELQPRHTDPTLQAQLFEAVNRRIPPTGSVFDDIYRAEREVWKVLKARSRTIQIANSLPEGAAHRVVFEA